MSRDIDPTMRAALVATMKTFIFQVLDATRPKPEQAIKPEDCNYAAGGAVALLAIAIEQLWGHKPAVAGVGVTLGQLLIQYRDQIPHALNSLSEDLGADLITKPKAEQLQKLQDFADAIAILDAGPDTDAMLCNVIERARDVSEQRPGGFKSATPLNDVFRRGREEYPFSAEVPGHEAPEGGEA